jgi:hypothetical protein
MASNFAFTPMGLSSAYTVGGGAPVTVSLVCQSVGATGTVALTGGNYIPAGIRLANNGTASLFIQFGSSATGLSVSPTIGMQMLSNSVETFRLLSRPFMALTCASTFTVTVGSTLGEGM